MQLPRDLGAIFKSVFGSDEKARESLAQYIAGCPIALEKIKYEHFHTKVLFKTPKYNSYF